MSTAPEVVQIEIGKEYEFHCEILEEQKSSDKRLRNYTGQKALVLSPVEVDAECSPVYNIRFADGHEAQAHQEELDGWDKALGQFYGPSGIWGDPS